MLKRAGEGIAESANLLRDASSTPVLKHCFAVMRKRWTAFAGSIAATRSRSEQDLLISSLQLNDWR
jgi:hypothetical protein